MKIQRFEDLEAWKLSLVVTKKIYDVLATEKFAKDFVLRDQMRRSAISVSSNIVEGFEKNNNNELIRFLKIAKGSAGEARSQLYVALAIGYIDTTCFNELNQGFISLSAQIGGFICYLEDKRLKGEFIKQTANSLTR